MARTLRSVVGGRSLDVRFGGAKRDTLLVNFVSPSGPRLPRTQFHTDNHPPKSVVIEMQADPCCPVSIRGQKNATIHRRIQPETP
jgi:hypothetical protein